MTPEGTAALEFAEREALRTRTPDCEAIVAEFVWGGYRCGEPAVTTAFDAMWGTEHPVCADHSRTPDAPGLPESPSLVEPGRT